MNAKLILERAAFLAGSYDRHAWGDVLYNLTDTFHLCGLIERAASLPKSGATHRRRKAGAEVDAAKAVFCRAHGVMHPSAWEWAEKPGSQRVEKALLAAAETATI